MGSMTMTINNPAAVEKWIEFMNAGLAKDAPTFEYDPVVGRSVESGLAHPNG